MRSEKERLEGEIAVAAKDAAGLRSQLQVSIWTARTSHLSATLTYSSQVAPTSFLHTVLI